MTDKLKYSSLPPEVHKAIDAIVQYLNKNQWWSSPPIGEEEQIWLSVHTLRDRLGMPALADVTRLAEDEWQAIVETERECVKQGLITFICC